jgi:hypothetical protein
VPALATARCDAAPSPSSAELSWPFLGRGQHGRERQAQRDPFAHELGRRDAQSLGHVVEPLSKI